MFCPPFLYLSSASSWSPYTSSHITLSHWKYLVSLIWRISNLSFYSTVSPAVCIGCWERLSSVSPCYSLNLHSNGATSFTFSLLCLFFPAVWGLWTNIFAFLYFFFLGLVLILSPMQCREPHPRFLQASIYRSGLNLRHRIWVWSYLVVTNGFPLLVSLVVAKFMSKPQSCVGLVLLAVWASPSLALQKYNHLI